MAQYKRWTCKEDRRLVDGIASGLDIGILALELGRSRGALESRLTKHRFAAEFAKRCPR